MDPPGARAVRFGAPVSGPPVRNKAAKALGVDLDAVTENEFGKPVPDVRARALLRGLKAG